MYYVTSKYILKCYYFILLNNREAFITTTNLRYLYTVKVSYYFLGFVNFFPLLELFFHLQEIDEMIHTVDKNGDGKISFSEFR